MGLFFPVFAQNLYEQDLVKAFFSITGPCCSLCLNVKILTFILEIHSLKIQFTNCEIYCKKVIFLLLLIQLLSKLVIKKGSKGCYSSRIYFIFIAMILFFLRYLRSSQLILLYLSGLNMMVPILNNEK